MFSHIMLGADDIAQSRRFYDAVFAAIGVAPGVEDGQGRVMWITPKGVFMITRPINGQPASCGNGSTVGFAIASTAEVDAWHAAGVANGGTSIEDLPGFRPGASYYLAYLRDPAGNKLCGLHQPG